jgi:hypothetical protein
MSLAKSYEMELPPWSIGPLCGPYGPLILQNLGYIKEFAAKNSLVNINTPEHAGMLAGYTLANLQPQALPDVAASVAAQLRRPIYGGMKLPHLHYGDNIYLLSDKQWADFSSKVLTDVKAKLGATQKVTFEQLAEVAAGTQTL